MEADPRLPYVWREGEVRVVPIAVVLLRLVVLRRVLGF